MHFSCHVGSPIKGGVIAKELFHSYITSWIEEKRCILYEFCKSETVLILQLLLYSADTRTYFNAFWMHFDCFQVKACSEIQGLTSPFVDEMYELLNATLDEYDDIIRRWPEYALFLEKVSKII